MPTKITAALVLTIGLVLTPTIQAQTAPQPRTPDQVVNLYATRLALTDDQKTKLRPVIADRQQQMLDLRNDTTLAPRDKAQKMKYVIDSTTRRINAILTPDQQKKYAALEAEQREKMKERRQGTQN